MKIREFRGFFKWIFSHFFLAQKWIYFSKKRKKSLNALAWTQRRMKIVTLLFENQTKWMKKIKRILMLAEVRNENVIYFHSALLLTKTGFVQKTRPEIT
jgi:hypothetical protein